MRASFLRIRLSKLVDSQTSNTPQLGAGCIFPFFRLNVINVLLQSADVHKERRAVVQVIQEKAPISWPYAFRRNGEVGVRHRLWEVIILLEVQLVFRLELQAYTVCGS